MKESARAAFPRQFTEPLEGRVASMYVDVLGLVTIGAGCLIDPVSLALPLRFTHGLGGALATRDEIAAAWHTLKSRADAFKTMHYKYAAALNDLRLDDDAIDGLVLARVASSETELRRWFPRWDDFPADAQLCCMSMAWALGPGFPRTFTSFRDSANRQDWAGAGLECTINTVGNPGIVPRNAQNRLCCANAAAVIAQNLDPETLFWPSTVPSARERDEALRAEAAAALARSADRERDVPPTTEGIEL